MTEITELVETLEVLARHCEVTQNKAGVEVSREAASALTTQQEAIEALRGERDEWRDGYKKAVSLINLKDMALAETLAQLSEAMEALTWIRVFAEMRAVDDSKVFAKVGRQALRNIANRASALSTLEGKT